MNVTHGLVRHYFGTRQALLDEALEQAIDEDITALTLATAHPEAFADGVFTTEDERGDHPRPPPPSPPVGAALTIRCMWPTLMSWQATAAMTGAAYTARSLPWVCACLHGHRA